MDCFGLSPCFISLAGFGKSSNCNAKYGPIHTSKNTMDRSFLKYAALIAVILGLPSIGRKAYRTLLRFQFDTNCLMLLASVGAVALQDYSEAAAVVFLFAISEWLEVRATSRARDALAAIVHLRPETANLVHPTTKELIVVPASVVPVGSIVCIKTGDKVPCDGVVIEGNSTVDESSLTGESRPVKKSATDAVSGGTVNSGFPNSSSGQRPCPKTLLCHA